MCDLREEGQRFYPYVFTMMPGNDLGTQRQAGSPKRQHCRMVSWRRSRRPSVERALLQATMVFRMFTWSPLAESLAMPPPRDFPPERKGALLPLTVESSTVSLAGWLRRL